MTSKTIKQMLAGLDKKSERYKITKEYLENRARPGEEKTVTIAHKDRDGKSLNKNQGLPASVTLIAGACPCSICGHEFMWECDAAECICCSSACT